MRRYAGWKQTKSVFASAFRQIKQTLAAVRKIMRAIGLTHWKHPSITRFAEGKDPVAMMLEAASTVTLNARQEGWQGPPFDPFSLAEILNIDVIPNGDILDARTVPIGGNKLRIEYNPNRNRARMRYSVAHEIAHSFFPDVAEQIRNRVAKKDMIENDWQLEMLCNLGAAELLMPVGSLAGFQDKELSIKEILELRKDFEVSTESILLRLIRVTNQPYILFTASRANASGSHKYRTDYSIASRAGEKPLASNFIVPKDSIVASCTAIGYTAIADENWPGIGEVHVECVGLSPYPESIHPRIAGLLRIADSSRLNVGRMQIVTGDATRPHYGTGPKIIAHIVNDATPNWGAGFGKAVKTVWPEAQRQFREAWMQKSRIHLGDVFLSKPEEGLTICQMVCQHGYGQTYNTIRLRYSSLKECLKMLRDAALESKSTIHMPRIGTGEAGGSWELVAALIDEVLCAAGLSVTIYDLPDGRKKRPLQPGLFDTRG